jgi:hypothetical protein
MDLVFSDKHKLAQLDLFPKATLYDFEPRRLVVETKNPPSHIEIHNPTNGDIELLEQNGVTIFRKNESGIKPIQESEKSS